ncbi:hypothetical protein INP51_14255 [Blautia liquoris]|uniref:Uncharacterized protein n=1 Tax=Blautia liquoris TaxID=2779518 RepID=A0A7M2RFR5_9FIRM|nr:DUF5685 family protein [Blautia liquoris]QOV19099.1 hypothetical protein INP51_14255 [Blautia liquoris]
MFGYVMINKEELKLKDYQKYQAFYCGVCQELKESYGQSGRLTLTYDMTFLAILLTSLYERKTDRQKRFCAVHPVKKHPCLRNEYTSYAADMNVLLAYYNLMDDWEDENKKASYAAAKLLEKSVRNITEKYPRQTRAVLDYLKKIHECEKDNSQDLDLASGLTGEVLGELYVTGDDIWSEDLRELGFYIGKFIYLMDAFEDLEKDKKSGNYNPLKFIEDTSDFQNTVEEILKMMAASASKAFERLPIIENVDILRNILYIGIWTKYDTLTTSKDKDMSQSGGHEEK